MLLLFAVTALARSKGILVAPHRLDSLRHIFQAPLSQALGGKVRFEAITAQGFQRFRVTDLAVGILLDNGAQAHLQVPKAEVQVNPFDLLRGGFGIRAIQLDGATLDLNGPFDFAGQPDGGGQQRCSPVSQRVLTTPGCSIEGHDSIVGAHNEAGAPPLLLEDVKFDLDHPHGVETMTVRFQAQLGNNPARRLEAYFQFASFHDVDVFVRGSQLSRVTITPVFPGASGHLRPGVFHPEGRT